MKKIIISAISMAFILSACAGAGQKPSTAVPNAQSAAAAPVTKVKALGVVGQSVAALDRTSDAEKQAALAAPAKSSAVLGKAVVALGAPAEQGLWVQTNLVRSKQPGRVSLANGKSLAVELRPHAGSALMSLAAYQALGVGLTDLPEVTIQSN